MDQSNRSQTIDLSGSRWAPISSRSSTAQSTIPRRISPQRKQQIPVPPLATPQQVPQILSLSQKELLAKRQDHARFAKLLRRLRWKCMSLATGYQRALQIHQAQHVKGYQFSQRMNGSTDSGGGSVSVWDIPAEEAETMFKIDFFEFYVLLERVIVHLLAVFGMKVKAAPAHDAVAEQDDEHLRRGSTQAVTTSSIIGDSRTFYGYSHRFHQNVLAALENPRCPLHHVLGTGTVIEYLRMTKDFRNRWKDVDDRPPEDNEEEWLKRRVKRYEKVMKDLQLESMLDTILSALQNAGRLAEQELHRIGDGLDPILKHDALHINAEGAAEWHMSDVPWEAVADRMDLDS